MNIEHFKLAFKNCNATPKVRGIAQRVASMLEDGRYNEAIEVSKEELTAILHITEQMPNRSWCSLWLPIFDCQHNRVDISTNVN